METATVVDLAARSARATKAIGELESGGRFQRIVEQLQAELVAQWLKEVDPERRERCWNECRALEVVLSRLLDELAEDLGIGDDAEEDRARVPAGYQRLERIIWRNAWERWTAGIRKWRSGW